MRNYNSLIMTLEAIEDVKKELRSQSKSNLNIEIYDRLQSLYASIDMIDLKFAIEELSRMEKRSKQKVA